MTTDSTTGGSRDGRSERPQASDAADTAADASVDVSAADGRADVHVVAAALVDDLDRPRTLLAARRTAPERLRGRWELPGGKVEPGEGRTEALRRELAEELGVTVRVGEPLPGPLPDHAWPLAPGLRMSVWFAVVTGGEPRCLQDHDALRTLRADSLDAVPWLESNTAIVEALRTRLASPGPPGPGSSSAGG